MDDARITADALAAAGGDRRALAAFVRATQGEVHRLCAYLVPVDDAADVAQDTFVRAIRALPRYRGDAPARLWLLSIARRTCADHFRTRYRRRGIESRLPPVPDRVPPSDPTLWALLDHLEPNQRTAFVLTQVLGLPYAEAAAVAGCPVGTIRSRVARARAALVALLAAAEAAGGPPDPADRVGEVASATPAPGPVEPGNQALAAGDWTTDVPPALLRPPGPDVPGPGARCVRWG